jgi:hypothetical protein
MKKVLVSFTFVHAILHQYMSKLTSHRSTTLLSVGVSYRFYEHGSQKETPGWIDREKLFRLLTLKWVLLVTFYYLKR